jgi:hypothetical protein
MNEKERFNPSRSLLTIFFLTLILSQLKSLEVLLSYPLKVGHDLGDIWVRFGCNYGKKKRLNGFITDYNSG